MWGIMRRWYSGNRDAGAAAVETALVLPLIILIVFGIIEFGLLFNRLQGVHAASREAARLGSLADVTIEEVKDRAWDAAPPFIQTQSDVAVSVSRIRIQQNGVERDTTTWAWDGTAWGGAATGTEAPCDETFLEADDPNVDTEVSNINIRVELLLTDGGKYGVTIPLFGSFAFQHPSTAEFRCEF